MKKQSRRQFSSAFKAKVALEAIKGQHTLAELAKKFEVNQVVISRWKAEFLANMGSVFDRPGKSEYSVYDHQVCHTYFSTRWWRTKHCNYTIAFVS